MSKKKKVVSGRKFRMEKSKARKNISPILMSLCIFLLLLIILPIATIMWYSEGAVKDDEYGIEKVSTSIEKEENSVDTNLTKSKATTKSPAIPDNRRSASSTAKENIPVNKTDIPDAEEALKEEVTIQEVPIENNDGVNSVIPESVPEYHTVEEGEGLWRIAKNNNLTLEEIKNLNNLTSDVIQVGQSLIVKN